VFASVSENVVL